LAGLVTRFHFTINAARRRKGVYRTTTRDYLHNNPEILLDVLAALKQQHEMQLEEKRHQTIRYKWSNLYESSWSPALGSKDADVTIVEFLDYRGAYCRRLEYAQAGPLIDSAEISGALRSDIELAKELALSKTLPISSSARR
jgi:protein-disulfide isomerase